MERKESVEDGRSEGEEGVGGREWEESEAGVANWTMVHGVGLDSVLGGDPFLLLGRLRPVSSRKTETD
jgi:hypothetical protein